MTYSYAWLALATASLLASMVPGLSFALVFRHAICASRAAGIWTALGLALGMSVHALLVIFGLSAIILKNSLLFNTLRIGGAIYLLYIGIPSIFTQTKRVAENIAEENKKIISVKNAISIGMMTNMLNPKVMLFFLALFTQFLTVDMPRPVIWIYGFTSVGIEFLWFSLVSIVLTHSLLQHQFAKIALWVERLAGVVLVLISLHVFITTITG